MEATGRERLRQERKELRKMRMEARRRKATPSMRKARLEGEIRALEAKRASGDWGREDWTALVKKEEELQQVLEEMIRERERGIGQEIDKEDWSRWLK